MLLTKCKNKSDSIDRFDPFSALSLFDDHLPSAYWNEARSFLPQVDVSENSAEYKVSLEAPGIAKDEIKLEIENGVLTLSGEKKETHKDVNERHYHLERKYGSFSRSFRFIDIEEDKVSASYKNGVLTVTIPKSEKAQPTKIAIE